jgi:hypothetical protein
MRTKPQTITRSLVVYGSIVLLLACNTPSSSDSVEGPDDVEAAYFQLSKEVQTDVLGTQVKSMGEMRRELLAKADADGDGQLSEDEKDALRAEWLELKEQMKAELKAKVDTDGDGEVSSEEKKAELEAMGQKIKEAIQTRHAELRAEQEEARERIKAACAEARGSAAQLQKPDGVGNQAADGGNTGMEECKAVMQEEKDSLHALRKESLEALKAEIEELKGLLATVVSESTTI